MNLFKRNPRPDAQAPAHERGQGLVEYALILSLVSVALISIMTVVGEQTVAVFENTLCNLEGGEDCNCETNEQFITGPNYSCVAGIFAFETLTSCRDKTSLTLMITGHSDIGLDYNGSTEVFETMFADSAGLCDAIEGSPAPNMYIISRHTEDAITRVLPFGGGGSSGGSEPSGGGSEPSGGGSEPSGGGSEPPAPTNTAPVLNSIANVSVDEGTSKVVNLTASDSDGDSLTFSSSGLESFMVLTDNGDGTATIAIAPEYDDQASYPVTITVSDGNGGTASKSFTITVVDVALNHTPVLDGIGQQTLDEGASSSVAISTSDPDGDALTITASGLTSFMTFVDNGDGTASLALAPNFGDTGTYAVTIEVADPDGEIASETFNVVVNNVNQNPVLTAIDNQMLDEGTTVDIAISASDPDGDSVSIQITGQRSFMDFADNLDGTALLRLTPGTDDAGSYEVTINVSDGHGGSTYQTFIVSVTDVPITVRVTDGLEVLYYFDSTSVSGSTISPSGGAAAVSLGISDTRNVELVTGGLYVKKPVRIMSSSSASSLVSHIKATNEITLEVWIQPKSTSMTGASNGSGLAQIVSLSAWDWWGNRDFTLGQNGSQYQMQLLTGGYYPTLNTGVSTNLTHLLYTRDALGSVKLYVNGSVVATQTQYDNFSTWQNYKLLLANEDGSSRLSDYDWAGTYYLVAIYSKALTNAEVQQNYQVGATRP